MSVFRQITLALLLIALLPWGAYPGKTAVAPGELAAWPTDLSTEVVPTARPAPDHALQKPLVKCRQGLPGFRCSTDPGTLVQASRAGTNLPRDGVFAPRAVLLPQGQSPGPRLRPPISA